jgi:hypothetical protein
VLAGVRSLSGDKIQNFLASELRDRITKSGVRILILDHASRRELVVEPRKFKGRLIHQLPEIRCPFGELYLELYIAESPQDAVVGLQKRGTRVLSDISRLDYFARPPWDSRQIEGLIDAPFLQLTPGTRDGVVLDEAYESFCVAIAPVEAALNGLLEEQRRAEEEEASRQVLNRVTRAFREAFLHLPTEDYSWLAARTSDARRGARAGAGGEGGAGADATGNGEGQTTPAISGGPAENSGTEASFGEYIPNPLEQKEVQRDFFEYAGPLYKLMIFPASSVIGVGERKKLKAVARDRAGRMVEGDIAFEWHIADGGGALEGTDSVYAEYVAPEEPCVAAIELKAVQGETVLTASALVTVTADLVKRSAGAGAGIGGAIRRGLPGYTYQKAPGQLWPSRYDMVQRHRHQQRTRILLRIASAMTNSAIYQPVRQGTRARHFPEATKGNPGKHGRAHALYRRESELRKALSKLVDI